MQYRGGIEKGRPEINLVALSTLAMKNPQDQQVGGACMKTIDTMNTKVLDGSTHDQGIQQVSSSCILPKTGIGARAVHQRYPPIFFQTKMILARERKR